MKYLGTRRFEHATHPYEVFSLTKSEADALEVHYDAVAVLYSVPSNTTYVYGCEVFDTHFNACVNGLVWFEKGSPLECFARRGVRSA